MWRVGACALLVFCVGCRASTQEQQPEQDSLRESSAFILESPTAFWARPADPLPPSASPKPAR